MRKIIIVVGFVLYAAVAHAQTVVADRVRLNTGPCLIFSGTAIPEGSVLGKPCDSYVQTTTGVWYTKWTGTATNTGWAVGFNTNARINGNTTLTGSIGLPNYVSQTSGWLVDNLGAADFRYLYADQMHVKNFIADIEQALAGLQIISKSVAPLSQSFTCPSPGSSSPIVVESFPGYPDVQVFQINDWLSVRQFDRSLGRLDIADCLGRASAPMTAGMVQTWLFTRGTGSDAGAATTGAVIGAKALALDYGPSGSGYNEVNSIDGIFASNSPYSQTVTFGNSPAVGNRVVRTRTGNLRGVTGVVGEYGLYAAGPAPGPGEQQASLRVSNSVIRATNIDVELWSGSTKVIALDHTGPSLAIGAAVPTGYSAGTGIWMGRDVADGVYKFRVGNPLAGRVTWDGTTLQIVGDGGGVTNINGANIQTGTISADKGTFGSGLNQLRNADCRASVDEWGVFGNSGQTIVQGFSLPTWNLNNETATCYVTIAGGSISGTVSGVFTTYTFPVIAGNRYEASSYLGVHRTGPTFVYVQWFNSSGAYLGQVNGTQCTTAFSGGPNLSNYCRSVAIGNAPAGATQARFVIQTTHSGESDPFIFYVHAFFGEATANQSEASPWGPPGLTEIIGGMIRTRTILADKIVANSITGNEIQANTINSYHIQVNNLTGDRIQVGTLNADRIIAETITGDKIAAGTITADKIQTNTITALGNITAGTFSLGGGNFTVGPFGALTANSAVFGPSDTNVQFLKIGDGLRFMDALYAGSIRPACFMTTGQLLPCP